jgi:putative transposase
MKYRRHTPEQIVRKLREPDRMLGEGVEPPEVMKVLEVSEATCGHAPERREKASACVS